MSAHKRSMMKGNFQLGMEGGRGVKSESEGGEASEDEQEEGLCE